MSNASIATPVSEAVGLSREYKPTESPALKALGELAATYTFRDVERAVAEGKAAIWGGTTWELPLIYACDVIPISIMELWREESHATEAVAESYFQVPAEFCSMIKTIIGRLHLRKNNEPIHRLLAFSSVCEPINVVMELAKQDGYDVHYIDAVTAFKPEDKRPDVVRFLVDQLQKVAYWLTGKPADEERVGEEIRRKNHLSAKVRRVLELRLKAPLYMPSFSVLQLMFGYFHYYGNPSRFSDLLDRLAEELEEAARHPDPRPYIPLVLAGAFLGGPHLYSAVETAHGAIVGWEIFGTRDYREDIPPLDAIAHYLLDAQLLGQYGEMVGAAVHLRKVHIEKLVKQAGARGVIAGNITGCPYGSIVPQLEREHFKKLGIPYISLETTVHNDPPTEEQLTRVKAFVEMLS